MLSVSHDVRTPHMQTCTPCWPDWFRAKTKSILRNYPHSHYAQPSSPSQTIRVVCIVNHLPSYNLSVLANVTRKVSGSCRCVCANDEGIFIPTSCLFSWLSDVEQRVFDISAKTRRCRRIITTSHAPCVYSTRICIELFVPFQLAKTRPLIRSPAPYLVWSRKWSRNRLKQV